jgi:hypothetical protein
MTILSMTANSEGQKRDDVLLGLIESLRILASDSTALIFNRFEAVSLLLRLAIGPRHRTPDSVDLAVSRHARLTLSEATSFLEDAMISMHYRARIRLHAASLAKLVTKVVGRATPP